MKQLQKLLLITFLNVAFFSNAQETKFELTANGYEPKVFELPNQNKEDIYKLTKKWVVKTYKNPKEVLTADIENENIKLNGFSTNIVKWSSGAGWDLYYTFEIEFKDNKYRLSVTADIAGNQIEYSSFFKKDGSKKTGYKGGPETIDNHINSIVDDLNTFLKNKGEVNKW
jgi:hypothetical protein